MRVERYRVTVERIEEPEDVIKRRVVEMYDATRNIHESDALFSFARKRWKVRHIDELR